MKERERFSISEDECIELNFDWGGCETLEWKDEKYYYVTDYLVEGDGEWHEVIYQRESDNKFFANRWGYNHGGFPKAKN